MLKKKNSDNLKIKAATAALDYLSERTIIGIGTGTTTNCFIELLSQRKHLIEACVASSLETARRLKAHGFLVLDLPLVDKVEWYIDGADEVNAEHQMIKGGGGALTREKILANAAHKFICIVESRKWVKELGQFPVAVEVIPMARSLVARALVDLGCDPAYRPGFITDNGNIILDAHHCKPQACPNLERDIKLIPGVVENGLFLHRRADIVLCANEKEVKVSELKGTVRDDREA